MNFTAIKTVSVLEDIDTDNVLVSSKISSGEKHINALLVTYMIIIKLKLLYRMLPNTRAYVKSYDEQTKWIYFLIEDDDL